MTTLNQYIEEKLQDPKFAEAWEESEAEYQLRLALIEAREAAGMTQKDLAAATGLKQQSISRIETGDTNPTFATLATLARGLGKKMKIEFV